MNELQHHGVKGMKWGKTRAEKKYARIVRNAGAKAGYAKYERDAGDYAFEKRNTAAKTYDKMAKNYEAKGAYFRAGLARRKSFNLRATGEAERDRQYEYARRQELHSEALLQKASSFATKKRIDAGKKTVDTLFKRGKLKGYHDLDIRREEEAQMKRDEQIQEAASFLRDLIGS